MEVYREVKSVTNKQPLDEKIDRNKRGKGEGRRLVVSSQPRIGAVVKNCNTGPVGDQGEEGEGLEAWRGGGGGLWRWKREKEEEERKREVGRGSVNLEDGMGRYG
jgi:hypothetical protein